MASIRKSFSFRNGVQVDEDNFIVNPNGLVGIGTSVPSEFLDVRGTAKIVGLVTANDVFVSGIATITEIQVGTAITISSGIITASKFFGDGATLSNLPTSQWEDVNLGLGFTSIYAIGNVGIATTDPRQSFQVGGDPATAGKSGVGINSIGNVRASGIITASSFVGALTGDVVGDVTGDLTGAVTGNVTGNLTGNVDGDVNSTGISTFTQLSVTGLVNVGTAATFNTAGLDVTGITTSTTFVGALTGNVTGNVTGNLTGDVTGDINSGIITASNEINVGTGGTAFTSLNTGKVAIGTDIPTSDLTIKKANDALFEVIGESGISKISIGQSGTDGTESALIRYGNPDGSLNFINYNSGSVNTFIHSGGSTGIQTGRFSWIYGQTNLELLSLTHDGRLGLGITNPDHTLHVVGTSTITSDVHVGNDLFVADDVVIKGGLSVDGVTVFPDVIGGTNLNSLTGISTLNNVSIGGSLTLEVGANSFIDVKGGRISANKIGIGTTAGTPIPDDFNMRVIGRAQLPFVGINTIVPMTGVVPLGFNDATADADGLHTCDVSIGLDKSVIYVGHESNILTDPTAVVGIGTTMAFSAVDFRLAGSGAATTTTRYMLPPIVTTDEKVGLGTTAGGVVYDSTLNKLQCFDGTTWNNLF